MSKKRALVIFVKTPALHHVKTRLASKIGPNYALNLYIAFLKDINTKFSQQTVYDTWYAVSPDHCKLNSLKALVDMSRFFMQEGMDLGARMSSAFNYLFQLGYQNVALIGTDIPEINRKIIDSAFTFLGSYDCVIGPSTDGGYYLIGLNQPFPKIFEDITWSSNQVLRETQDQLRNFAIKTKLLVSLDDIDTFEDMHRLYLNLEKMDKGDPEFPQNTWQMLHQIENKIRP